MDDLVQHQLEVAREEVYRLRKINSVLEEYYNQKKALEEKKAELQTILQKEELDVEKLEGSSLSHLFHSVLGNLEEKLIKERQEALAAHLKYDQAVRDLENMSRDMENLISERTMYKGAEDKYRDLYNRKKELLLHSNSEASIKIMKLSEQISADQNMRKEINEAQNAGAVVLQHLKSAMNSLNSAEGWGTWDLLGGGLISDMIKHGHIDDAAAEVEQTNMALLRFRTELADIRIDSSIHIETDGFGKFADFFFDGLIADWCMQSRIHESQASVEHVMNQVQAVIHKLNSIDQELARHLDQLQQEIINLVNFFKKRFIHQRFATISTKPRKSSRTMIEPSSRTAFPESVPKT